MKKYTTYVCEKCGLEFKKDPAVCLDHEEKAHTEPGTLWGEVTNPAYLGPASYYPDSVDIPMKDGSVVRYTVEGVVKGTVEPEKESPSETD